VGLMAVQRVRLAVLLQVLVQMLFQMALDGVVDQLVQLPAAAALASPHGVTAPALVTFMAWAPPRHQRPAATARSPPPARS